MAMFFVALLRNSCGNALLRIWVGMLASDGFRDNGIARSAVDVFPRKGGSLAGGGGRFLAVLGNIRSELLRSFSFSGSASNNVYKESQHSPG